MKISIVTPTYNSAEYIREAFDSIHNQTYTNFEHIVMDGASQDETLRIVESYKNILCKSEHDNGQSDALNKGFKYASGDILAWQNSDDVYFPETFANVVEYFETNPNVDLVYGYYQMIDSKSKWICDVYPIAWNRWLFQHGRFCPVQPTVFWRRKVWEQCGALNEDLNFCMDVDFYSKAVNRNFIISRIPQMLGKFRVHASSKTQNSMNASKVYSEYKSVLKTHFKFNALDSFLFELFQVRANVSKEIKQRLLKKL